MRDKKMLGLGKNKQIKKLRMNPLPLMKPSQSLPNYVEELCQKTPSNIGMESTKTGQL